MQNGAFSGHLRVSKKAWPGTILITWINKVCSKSTLLALADTHTNKIPAQISKKHRYVLPGRNMCCLMGYESENDISVAFSYKLLRYESVFFMILMISSWISGEAYFSLLLVFHCNYMFGKYWVTMCLWIQNCHQMTWLQSTTAYTVIFGFHNSQQCMLVFHYLGLF